MWLMNQNIIGIQSHIWTYELCATYCDIRTFQCVYPYYRHANQNKAHLCPFFPTTVRREVVRSAEERSWGFVPAGQHLCWVHGWRWWLHGGLLQRQSHSLWVGICNILGSSFNVRSWIRLHLLHISSPLYSGSGLSVLTWLLSTQSLTLATLVKCLWTTRAWPVTCPVAVSLLIMFSLSLCLSFMELGLISHSWLLGDNYWVIDTDYDNYAITYACRTLNDDGTCEDGYALVFSRNPRGLPPAIQRVVRQKQEEICMAGQFQPVLQSGM